MGIHGSATCVMHFEEAEGYLIGAAAQGAALHVHDDERRPPRCRPAGARGSARPPIRALRPMRRTAARGAGSRARRSPTPAADPIIVHPDVRRMLLTQRAINEGSRALRLLGGAPARHLAQPRGRHGARGCGRAGAADDADHQGLLHRLRLRVHQSGGAGPRRPRLHPRARHGAARARCPHQRRSTRVRTASRRSIW